MLYDAWASCEGVWTKSTFLQSVRERHSTKRRGVRKWLTSQEMDTRFGEELAEQIRNRKLFDENLKDTEVREHPECVGLNPPAGFGCSADALTSQIVLSTVFLPSGASVSHVGGGSA